jgi:TatA/E family protein of Tat protein translocase
MLSLPHLVVIFVVALVIFGPQKLPELARMLGKATADFRRMTADFRFALEQEVLDLDRQTRIRDAGKPAAAPPTPVTQQQSDAPPGTGGPDGTLPRDEPLRQEPPREGNFHSEDASPSRPEQEAAPEKLASPPEKPSDDNAAV